jgi:hypothetical protein
MLYLIIFLLSITLLVLIGVLLSAKRYTEMLIGTIVGKYKGDKYKGGYVVVEMEIEFYNENSIHKQKRKEQKTYEVPEEYYTQKNIGDKGLFPC